MENFSKFITEPHRNQIADTNEFVGTLAVGALLSFMVMPVLNGGKDSKGGGFFSFLGNLFGGSSSKDNDKKDDTKKDDTKKDDTKKDDTKKDDAGKGSDDKKANDNKAFNSILMLAKQANEKDKNKHEQEKNGAMLKMLTAFSFDKDGKELPVEERINKMKDQMSPEQFEAFKKDMTDTYEKNKDNQDFKDALTKAKANIKPEDYDKMIEDAKKEAKATLEQLDKEKKELEEYDKKLKEIEDQINGTNDADEKKKLEEQQKKLQQNPPQTIAGAATGVSSTGAATNAGGEGEPKDPKDPKDPKGEPKEKTKEEIDAELKAIDAKYKQQEDDLNKEYQDKIDKETDPDKKKQLEDEWEKKSKEISSKKNKEKDDVDDTDAHDTEKDETKKGKYKVKDEEITDPKTGKKIKVKTYTGPRGGKFYYPEGSPKTPEHKVYVESLSLRDYLRECLI